MSLSGILKTKGVVIRQMEPIVEVVDEKKEEITPKWVEVTEKIEEVAPVVGEVVEKAVESVIEKAEEISPVVTKAVQVVDEALVGAAFSCGCLGWKFSVEKKSRIPSK